MLKLLDYTLYIQYLDNHFFKWAVFSDRNPVDCQNHPERVTQYKQHENELYFSDVEFLVSKKIQM